MSPFRAIFRHRGAVLAIYALLLLAFAFAARGVRMDFSAEQFFPTGSQARRDYDEYKASFPKEDTQVALFWQERDGLSAAVFQEMRAAVDLFEAQGLYDVTWFANAPAVTEVRHKGQQSLRLDVLVEDQAPSDAQLDLVLASHRRDPLLSRRVWSQDQTVFVIAGYLRPDQNTDTRRKEVEGALTAALATLEAPGRALVLNGIPILRSRYLKMMATDQAVVLGVGFLLAGTLLALVLRSRSQVLFALSSVLPAYALVVALMGLTGKPITVLSSVLPLILVVISLSDNIHVLVTWRALRAGGAGDEDALDEAMRRLAPSCFFTSLTTALGFLSLAWTGIDIIVDFGIFAAIGIMASWVSSMTLLPALLAFQRARRDPKGLHAGWLTAPLAVAEALPRRHPRAILAAASGLTGLALYAATGLQIDAKMIDDIKENTPLVQEMRWVEGQGFGLFQANLLLQGGGDTPVYSPESLAWMERFQRQAEASPLVLKTLSLADYLRPVRRSFARDGQEGLPETAEEAAQLLMAADATFPGLMDDVYDPFGDTAQIVLWMEDAGTLATAPLLAELHATLERSPPPVERHALTGTIELAQSSFQSILGSFEASVVSVIAAIGLLMMVLFRSVRTGLIALVPNLIPLALLLGVMALFGYAIKPSTVIVFSISFGIAVDDTIHMLVALREVRRAGGDPEGALRATLHRTGKAVVLTTAVLVAGFSALMASSFEVLFLIGFLTVTALIFALLTDLLVLPALLRVLPERR
ncbi:MAG: MMPL family transporter [Deltaproteobacteria bacterium]|nr:MMPL family transporter [Deltaproteobacteria bacterium]